MTKSEFIENVEIMVGPGELEEIIRKLGDLSFKVATDREFNHDDVTTFAEVLSEFLADEE